MTGGPWSEEEVGEARRDVAALLRASIADDQEGIAAILDGAGDRGTRAVAETLVAMFADLVVRFTVTAAIAGEAVGEDSPALRLALQGDTAVLTAEPAIRAAVEENLARVQGEIIEGR